MKIDIVVLNYNGERLMPECMPSIIKAKNSTKHDVKVHVIDNESTDKSIEILKRWAGEVNVIPHKNEFLASFDDVVADLSGDVVVLLNNDIKVDSNFIDPLADVFFSYSDVFMVAPKVLTFDGREENGATMAKVRMGLFWSSASAKLYKDGINNFSYTFSSGFGAFDRKKFVLLKGYDRLYLPGRFEDADLSLRAWRMGWKSYYEPKSAVYHMGQSAFKEKFGAGGINKIDGRNTFLFMWKNYDAGLLAIHIIFLPLWFAYWGLKGASHYISGFSDALKNIATIKERRALEKKAGYLLSSSKALAKSWEKVSA